MAISVLEFRGIETYVIVHHRFQCRLCEFIHLKEPLHGEFRLDDNFGTFGIAHLIVVVLYFFHKPPGLKVLDDFLAHFKAVMTYVHATSFRDSAVGIEYIDDWEIIFFTEHIVVHIMCRGHLEAARTEIHLHIFIHNNGDNAANERYNNLLPFQPLITFIIGIDTHGCITEDGFGAGRGNDNILVLPFHIIFQMEQLGMLILVNHFLIGKSRQGCRIPVYHTHSAINQPLVIKVTEHTDNALGAGFIHGECRAAPVA